MSQIRLDRFLSSQLPDLSRSDARERIRSGSVAVNGTPCRLADRRINPEHDAVTLDGVRIGYKEHLYIMLNKPAGVVCATRDGLSETVLELLPPELRRPGLFPAGRLDKDTVGFVFITDDGQLAHRLLSPKHHIDKKYTVFLKRPIVPETGEIFASGMELDGERLLPAELFVKGERECELILKEGKYHQIKRMFEALGNEVIYLKRTEFAGIVLDESLAEGQARELAPLEEMAVKTGK